MQGMSQNAHFRITEPSICAVEIYDQILICRCFHGKLLLPLRESRRNPFGSRWPARHFSEPAVWSARRGGGGSDGRHPASPRAIAIAIALALAPPPARIISERHPP